MSTIIKCSKIAAVKAAEITAIIQNALATDPSITKSERYLIPLPNITQCNNLMLLISGEHIANPDSNRTSLPLSR